MTRYRKKPVVIDAFRWTGGPDRTEDPDWIVEAVKESTVFFWHEGFSDVKLCVHTLEGTMTAEQGDYIIRGLKGEIYPCKPDIFEMSYELVE